MPVITVTATKPLDAIAVVDPADVIAGAEGCSSLPTQSPNLGQTDGEHSSDLDLSTRDVLHAAWGGGPDRAGRWRLFRHMGLLIAGGGLLSLLLSCLLHRGAGGMAATGRIAGASCLAFCAAGAADTLVYQRLRQAPYPVRANGSNLAAALVDSIVFGTAAFGALLPGVILGQWAAKAGGGALWAWLLCRWMRGADARA